MEDESEGGEGMTEYEKQRQSRIRENKARMEALGLHGLASSLRSGEKKASKSEMKIKKRDRSGGARNGDDDEYLPSDDQEEAGDSPSSQEEEQEEERPSSSRRKGKKKIILQKSKPLRSFYAKGSSEISDFMDDDTALAQAIALSLGERSSLENNRVKETKAKSAGKRSTKKPNKSRIQLSEDEVIAFFFLIDERGKGYITARDVQRITITHDFTWTENEIINMIHLFDSNGDGRLSLEDFRTIVSRCNMLQESGG